MTRSLAKLLHGPLSDPQRISLWTQNEVTSWAELQAEYHRQRVRFGSLAGVRVGVRMRADRWGIATLAALEAAEARTFLLSDQLSAEQTARWAEMFSLQTVLNSAEPPVAFVPHAPSTAPLGQGSVTILTSGTSGQPKAAEHTWQGLARPVRTQPGAQPPVWLLAFRPHLYAGLQVILQALLNEGTLVVTGPADDPEEIARRMRDARVQFGSATPSFWRRLLLSAPADVLREVPLQQITLGGEIADQPILDRLAQRFPQARLVHIYATTELGRCFAVADGRAGFPATLLDHPTPDGVELRVVDDQLWVRSANAMAGYVAAASSSLDAPPLLDQAGWFATGDLVRREGDRWLFAGRATDLINVGGNKVSPAMVERVIRKVDQVSDVRVFAKESSLAGQLVACQLVLQEGADQESTKQQVRAICQAELERHQVPRLLEVVERLELNEAGKLARR